MIAKIIISVAITVLVLTVITPAASWITPVEQLASHSGLAFEEGIGVGEINS